jgi:hypothetical protein
VPCAAHRPWIGDRGHLASPPLAKPTQLVPSGKSIHVQLHFRFSSVSPGWRRDRARRQQEDRDEGRGRLSKDDARRMARQILRLPELVRIARGIDPSEA